jgi:hypothetical protein
MRSDATGTRRSSMARNFEHLLLMPAIFAALTFAVSTKSWALPKTVNATVHCICGCAGGGTSNILWYQSAPACVARNGSACVNSHKKQSTLNGCSTNVQITLPNTGVTGINRNGQGVSINRR